MATTETTTVSSTFSRVEVLAMQMEFIVGATTDAKLLASILRIGVIEKRWIEVLYVNGIDEADKIAAQIVIRVDWERNELHVSLGRNEISQNVDLPSGRRLDARIGAMTDTFNRIVERKALKTKWSLRYRANVDQAEANEILGLTTGPVREWVEGERRHALGIVPESLDELSIDLEVAVPFGDSGKTQRKRGGVKWFNPEKGFGFIIPDEPGPDLFVHYSQIAGEGFRQLEIGDRVEFEVEEGAKGMRAVSVSRMGPSAARE